MMSSLSILALLCVIMIQVALAIKREHLNDCHDNDIILDCPPFAKSKSKEVEMTWQYQVKTTKRWRTVVKVMNGKYLKNADNTHLRERLTVHHNGSLEIRTLKDEDERLYRCQVKKSAGKREIHVIELNLTCTGLTVTNRQVCVERDVVLDCKPTHKIDAINHGPVTWHKKNTQKNRLSWSVVSNTETSKEGHKLHGNGSLWIRGGRIEGEKVYRCVVAKSLKGSREMHLTVVRDVICRREKRQTEELHQVNVCIGDEVKLPCSILENINSTQVRSMKWRVRRSASPKHFQQLARSNPRTIRNQTIFVNELITHNSTRLHDAKLDSVSLESNGSLLVKNIRRVDEGDFECIVKTRHHHEAQRQTVHVNIVDCNNSTRKENKTVDQTKPTALTTNASNKTTTVAMTTEPSLTTGESVGGNESLVRNISGDHVTDQNSDMKRNLFTLFSAPPKTVSTIVHPKQYQFTQSPTREIKTTTSSPENINNTVYAHPAVKTSSKTWSVVKHTPGMPGLQTTIVTTVTTSVTTTFAIQQKDEVTSKQDNTNGVRPRGRTPNCGGNLTAATGGFQSPNFPKAYPVNSNCKWTISLPQNYSEIYIKIEEMNIEHDVNCQNDYVAFYDELGNQVGRRRCGVSESSSQITVKVLGNLAMVDFTSDHSVQKPGFKLTYRGVLQSGK